MTGEGGVSGPAITFGVTGSCRCDKPARILTTICRHEHVETSRLCTSHWAGLCEVERIVCFACLVRSDGHTHLCTARLIEETAVGDG